MHDSSSSLSVRSVNKTAFFDMQAVVPSTKAMRSPGKLTWWFGKMRVSAMTTFSLRPALNTITSAMSSGVRGSQPLLGH